MATAIFIGLVMIAKAINPDIAPNGTHVLAGLSMAMIFYDSAAMYARLSKNR